MTIFSRTGLRPFDMAALRFEECGVGVPLGFDPLGVGFAVEDEEAVFGGVGFAGFDGPVAVLGGGDAELGVFGVEAKGLGEAEAGGVNEDGHAGRGAVDLAADVDPFGFGGVAGFAVVTFAGEHGDGVDGVPGEVAAHA